MVKENLLIGYLSAKFHLKEYIKSLLFTRLLPTIILQVLTMCNIHYTQTFQVGKKGVHFKVVFSLHNPSTYNQCFPYLKAMLTKFVVSSNSFKKYTLYD